MFGEIYRVLKPGGLFLSYEWVSTKTYDPNNDDHVRIIDEINFGNGLPEMRTYKEAENAGEFAMLGSYVLSNWLQSPSWIHAWKSLLVVWHPLSLDPSEYVFCRFDLAALAVATP